MTYSLITTITDISQQPASEISQEATQRVFSLLDSLNRHVELKKRALTERTKSPSKSIRGSPSTALRRVEELLNDIPQSLLATAALRVKAYARALLYYETHIRKLMKDKNKREFKDFIANDLAFLQKVYSGLDETDAVGGLSNLRSAASLSEQITELEAQGRWHEALLYYDQAMIEKEDDIGLFTGRLKCLQNLGRVEEVLELSRAALYDTNRFSKTSAGIIRLHGIRAAWRLSNWNALDNLLPGVVDPDFEVFLAKALVAMKKKDEKEFQEMVLKARNELIGPLSAASLDSYERAYPFIIKEHMLAELEQCWNLAKNGQSQELPSMWEPRLKISQHSFKPHEQILHLRIVLAGMYLPIEVGQNWLRLAKTARIAYQYDAAEHALLKASACRPRPDFYSVENAKLLLQQGKESLAIITLKREIENKPLVDIRSEGPSLSDFVTDETGSNGKKKNKIFSPADLCFAKNLVMLGKIVHRSKVP
jgi:serine/threonine-protein kinase ATR